MARSMFKKIQDFYSQDLRIDLTPAALLAKMGPKNAAYQPAAERGAFVVSVSQGDVHESVYVLLSEQVFDSLSEAHTFFETLRFEHPTAQFYDFAAHPSGGRGT